MFQLPPGVIVIVAFAILLVLPVRLAPAQLKLLAFFLWLGGGLAMSYNGIARLSDPSVQLDSTGLLLAILVTALVGIAKGIFVLSKTSAKNLARIEAMSEPQRPLAVYSARSWIVIGVMVLIAVSFSVFGAPMLWRGVISLGIGLSLVISSLRYLRPSPTAPIA